MIVDHQIPLDTYTIGVYYKAYEVILSILTIFCRVFLIIGC